MKVEMSKKAWENWSASLLLVLSIFWFGDLSAQRVVNSSPEEIRASFSAQKVNCLFFFVEDCPVSMRDFSVVRELRNKYDTTQLSIIAVYVGDKRGKLNAIADSIGTELVYTHDLAHELVEMAGASITPEYFVFDNVGELKYRGAIDNYAYGYAKHRKRVSKHYLEDAINAVLKGKRVATKSSRPYGCYIEEL